MKVKIRRGTFETNSSSVHSIVVRSHGGMVKYDEPFTLHFSHKNDRLYIKSILETPEEKIYSTVLRFLSDFRYNHEDEIIDSDRVYDIPEIEELIKIISDYTGMKPIFIFDDNYFDDIDECGFNVLDDDFPYYVKSDAQKLFDTNYLICDIHD